MQLRRLKLSLRILRLLLLHRFFVIGLTERGLWVPFFLDLPLRAHVVYFMSSAFVVLNRGVAGCAGFTDYRRVDKLAHPQHAVLAAALCNIKCNTR